MFTALDAVCSLRCNEPNLFNPWITEREGRGWGGGKKGKKPTFTELGTCCAHIFKIIFSTFFFSPMFD